MSKEPVYWTTKDGKKMNVDDMTDSHVRNSFKMVLRNIKKLEQKAKYKKIAEFMEPRGEIAQLHHDMMDYRDNGEDEVFDPHWDIG